MKGPNVGVDQLKYLVHVLLSDPVVTKMDGGVVVAMMASILRQTQTRNSSGVIAAKQN